MIGEEWSRFIIGQKPIFGLKQYFHLFCKVILVNTNSPKSIFELVFQIILMDDNESISLTANLINHPKKTILISLCKFYETDGAQIHYVVYHVKSSFVEIHNLI